MFKNEYQSGLLSILYSIGTKPLELWDTSHIESNNKSMNGYIKRIEDPDIESSVIELYGKDIRYNYITCPANEHMELEINLPFLILIIKNIELDFSFELIVKDTSNSNRIIRFSTFIHKYEIYKNYLAIIPLKLSKGWNHIQLDLKSIVFKLFNKSNYMHTLRITIHSNCRIRRIFFSSQLCIEENLPIEFRLYKKINSKTNLFNTNTINNNDTNHNNDLKNDKILEKLKKIDPDDNQIELTDIM